MTQYPHPHPHPTACWARARLLVSCYVCPAAGRSNAVKQITRTVKHYSRYCVNRVRCTCYLF